MKRFLNLFSMAVICSVSLCACGYQKVPAPPPSYNTPMPNLNSNSLPRLHPTLVLQKTTPVNKLSQS